MSVSTVQSLLKDLKLKTAATELSAVLNEHRTSAPLDWLVVLLQKEVDHRKERRIQLKIKGSKIPELKSLEGFDWDFNPGIDKGKMEALASLDFVRGRGVSLFLGQPGTGKSHLASAIGLKAILQGHGVYWSSMKRLAEDIMVAKNKNELGGLFRKILGSALWILDDWAVVSLGREVSEEVFDLLDRRKTGPALLLTSNRAIEEWPEVFVDPVLASAAIDRIFDRADVTIFRGKSYRAKGKKDVKISLERGTVRL